MRLPASWPRTFAALEYPQFRRYWISQVVSLTGTWMQATAQSYLVLELSGNNAAALGWVIAAQFTPSLLLSLFAGAVIDRIPRRRVLLATQVSLMATALALAVSTHLGLVTIPLVMGLAVLSGTANAFDMPARQSMVADFVPREGLANAVALNSLSFNVSRTLGQALFGVVAALGVALLAGGGGGDISRLALPFYLNVVSFVYVIYVLATLRFPARKARVQTRIASDIAEGLRYIRRTPGVMYPMLLVGALSLTVINFNVILPYFVRVVYGVQEAGFGFLNAMFGVGAMAGALWQASRPNPARNLRLGAGLLVVGTAVLALTPSAALSVPVLMLCGVAMLSTLISANSTVQLTVPDELRGRVMSVYSFVLVGMGPPGALISGGLLASPLGARGGVLALVALGAVAVLLLWRKLPRTITPPKD